MKVYDYVIEFLYANGIDTFFVVNGGAIVPLVNAVFSNKKTKYYCFQTEQSAAMAAEGYYRSCRRIACVLVTSGPGAQNILNGVCGCWYDSIPAFFITGQVGLNDTLTQFKASPRQIGFQEMPVCEIYKAVTKKCLQVTDNDDLNKILVDLITEVKSHRYGPVLLDFPVNLQMQELDKPKIQCIETTIEQNIFDYSIEDEIKKSKRPLFVLGHGIILSGCENEALDLCVQLNIPYVITWGAMNLSKSRNSLYIGHIGVYGNRIANFAVQNADLLIIIGARLETRQIGGNPKLFSVQSKKIMIDYDINEITKMQERGLHIDKYYVSDAKVFVNQILKQVKPFNINYCEWLSKINEWKLKYSIEKGRLADGEAYKYLDMLFKELPTNSIIIPDIGSHLAWTIQSATLKDGQNLFTNLGNASMGFSIPAAIGSAIAQPTIPIHVIIGDGSLQMCIQELHTINLHKLDITIHVLDNSGYGMIKQFQDNYFDSNYIGTNRSDLYGDKNIDFTKIAEGYGIKKINHIIIPESQRIYPKVLFGNSLDNMWPYVESNNDMIVSPAPRRQPGWV